MIYWLLITLSLSFGLEVPNQLSEADQVRTLEIIGLGTSSKFLSNSYPLGGYSGLEVSVSLESIQTKEIANLGTGADKTDNVHFPTITIGKGIYNNSDLFFHFIPPTETAGLSKYGFSFRWGFYQALFLPLNFSLVGHASSSNLQDKVITRNIGADLMTGLTLSDFSFFMGLGLMTSAGDFTGGNAGITASGASEDQKIESSHFMFGGTYNFDPLFIGLSIDRYKDVVYTGKVGFLF